MLFSAPVPGTPIIPGSHSDRSGRAPFPELQNSAGNIALIWPGVSHEQAGSARGVAELGCPLTESSFCPLRNAPCLCSSLMASSHWPNSSGPYTRGRVPIAHQTFNSPKPLRGMKNLVIIGTRVCFSVNMAIYVILGNNKYSLNHAGPLITTVYTDHCIS